MKLAEYGRIHGLKDEQDWINHFRHNLHTGKLPVALYSCLECDEIIEPLDGHECCQN